MNLSKFTAIALALFAGAAAQATTLTFDSLNSQYGDGYSLGGGVTGDGQNLVYSEGGYALTLHTTNDPSGTSAHIGDATYVSGTFNWHDDGDNNPGAYVTLTKVGGGAFNLTSFDYYNYNGFGLSVNGTNLGSGGGSFAANLHQVTSVTFSSDGYNLNQLDNVLLAGVPEPTSWALMIGGFGLTGFAMRRRSAAVVA